MKSFIILMSLLCFVWADSSKIEDDHHPFPMDLHDLQLTPKQHQAVEEAMREYQNASRRFHQQNFQTQQELKELFSNPVFDETSFRAKSMQMQQISVEIQIRLFKRLHTILTPQQKQRFIRHMQEWEVE